MNKGQFRVRKNHRKLTHLPSNAGCSPIRSRVSDITYTKTDEGFCYLNMNTEVRIRKIVGFAIAESMDVAYIIKACKMTLRAHSTSAAMFAIKHRHLRGWGVTRY